MTFRRGAGVLSAIVANAALCNADLAAAQDESFNVEITPFAAYRLGGQFDDSDSDAEFELRDSDTQGIILNIRANPTGQWELLYARQDTKVNTQGLFVSEPVFDIGVEYFHLGGTYLFEGDNVRPFIAMTLGVSYFDPQPAEFSSESFFSASFGGGIHLNASGRIGVRLEGRVFTTFLENGSNIFCSSVGGAGGCLIEVSGTTLNQWEARMGLVFRF